MSFNEKNQRQTKGGAIGEEARSQASQEKENPIESSRKEPHQAESYPQNAGEASRTAASESPKEIPVVKSKSVVDLFLQKGEDRAAEYIDILESMLGDDYHYGFAYTTLLGIYDFIEKHGYITEKQVEAVDNIRKSPYER
jgi:hypothetical protein